MAIRLEFTSDSREAREDLSRLEKSVDNIDKRAEKTNKTFVSFAKVLGTISAAFIASRGVVKLNDNFAQLENRIRLTSKSTQELITVVSRLEGVARKTNTSVDATAETYSRLRQFTDLGAQSAIRFTETLTKAGRIGGGSSATIQAAIIQLNQGLAAGALRGEELNSVLEGLPRVTQILADYLQVGVGEMKELAKQGKISTQVITKAFAEAGDTIDKEFNKIIPSIGEGLFAIRREIASFSRNVLRAFGFTGELGKSLIEFSKSIRTVGVVIALNLSTSLIRVETLFARLRRTIGSGSSFFAQFGSKLAAGFDKATVIFDTILTKVNTFADSVGKIFYDLYIYLVGNSVWPDMWEEMRDVTILLAKSIGLQLLLFSKTSKKAFASISGYATNLWKTLAAGAPAISRYGKSLATIAVEFPKQMSRNLFTSLGSVFSRLAAVFSRSLILGLSALSFSGAIAGNFVIDTVLLGTIVGSIIGKNLIKVANFFIGSKFMGALGKVLIQSFRFSLLGLGALIATGSPIDNGKAIYDALDRAGLVDLSKKVIGFVVENPLAAALGVTIARQLFTSQRSLIQFISETFSRTVTVGASAGAFTNDQVIRRLVGGEASGRESEIDNIVAEREARSGRILAIQGEVEAIEEARQARIRQINSMSEAGPLRQQEFRERTELMKQNRQANEAMAKRIGTINELEKANEKGLERQTELRKSLVPMTAALNTVTDRLNQLAVATRSFIRGLFVNTTAVASSSIAYFKFSELFADADSQLTRTLAPLLGALVVQAIASGFAGIVSGVIGLVVTGLGVVLGPIIAPIIGALLLVGTALAALQLGFAATGQDVNILQAIWDLMQTAWKYMKDTYDIIVDKVSRLIELFANIFNADAWGVFFDRLEISLLNFLGKGVEKIFGLLGSDKKAVEIPVDPTENNPIGAGISTLLDKKLIAPGPNLIIDLAQSDASKSFFIGIGKQFEDFFKYVLKPLVTGGPEIELATGGQITGPGSGTSDSIPAMLSNGEFVVNAASTKKNLALLHALNNGKDVRFFNRGGDTAGRSFDIAGLQLNADSGTTQKILESIEGFLSDIAGYASSFKDFDLNEFITSFDLSSIGDFAKNFSFDALGETIGNGIESMAQRIVNLVDKLTAKTQKAVEEIPSRLEFGQRISGINIDEELKAALSNLSQFGLEGINPSGVDFVNLDPAIKEAMLENAQAQFKQLDEMRKNNELDAEALARAQARARILADQLAEFRALKDLTEKLGVKLISEFALDRGKDGADAIAGSFKDSVKELLKGGDPSDIFQGFADTFYDEILESIVGGFTNIVFGEGGLRGALEEIFTGDAIFGEDLGTQFLDFFRNTFGAGRAVDPTTGNPDFSGLPDLSLPGEGKVDEEAKGDATSLAEQSVEVAAQGNTATQANTNALNANANTAAAVGTGLAVLGQTIGGSTGKILTIIGGLTTVMSGLITAITINSASNAASFATGGPVFGPGTGTSDSINARLSNGEYVVNAASTSKFRPILDAMNYKGEMPLPGFRDGGLYTEGASSMYRSSNERSMNMRGGNNTNINFTVDGDFDAKSEKAIRKFIHNGMLQAGLNQSNVENGGQPLFNQG